MCKDCPRCGVHIAANATSHKACGWLSSNWVALGNIKENENGEFYIELPENLINNLKWKLGDKVKVLKVAQTNYVGGPHWAISIKRV